MSPEKVYLSDCYVKKVSSTITDRIDDGENQWVVLDPLLFYPGGGGQAHDRGWIDDLEIKDTKITQGVPTFLIAGKPPDKVMLTLDWTYRYTNMQQHTGQHVLSAVLHTLFGMDTISVHLGSRETLIEISSAVITADQIESAEIEANRVVQKNLPVEILSIDKSELASYTIRRDVKTESDPIRLIRIGEYDLTGCGGTHVSNTAEIGLIKIIGSEKIRGHIRLAALIGTPAYAYYTLVHNISAGVTKDLSCAVQDIPDRVRTLMQDYKAANRALKGMTIRWIKEYIKGLEPEGSVGYFVLQELDSNNLSLFASEWISRFNKPVFAMVYQHDKYHFILHSKQDLKTSAREFIAKYGDAFNLKGGGNDTIVRGIMLNSKIDQGYSQKLINCLNTFFTSGEY